MYVYIMFVGRKPNIKQRLAYIFIHKLDIESLYCRNSDGIKNIFYDNVIYSTMFFIYGVCLPTRT